MTDVTGEEDGGYRWGILGNIGTHGENIDAESATENSSTRKIHWLKPAVKNYFCLGVHTSDPLLNAAKWIAYVTEIGATAIVALPLPLYFLAWFFAIFHSAEAFLIFAMICWIFGLVWWTAFGYVHFMWVKPSRHLLLGLQQLSTLKFLPWMLSAFIHSTPLAWLGFCYMFTSTGAYPYKKTLRADLTSWDWIFATVVAALILTPQGIVLAAARRVRRLSKERTRIRSPDMSSTAPPVAEIPTTTSHRPANNIRSDPLQVTVDLPESSASQNDFNDLPPSYSMAVLQCPPEFTRT